VQVLSVVSDDAPDTGAAAKRQAVMQQAVVRSKALDMARLVLAVDGGPAQRRGSRPALAGPPSTS